MLQKSFVNFLQEGNVSIAQKEVTVAEGKHRLLLTETMLSYKQTHQIQTILRYKYTAFDCIDLLKN